MASDSGADPRILDLRIVHYADNHIADPRNITEELTEDEYLSMRNEVVRVCRRHGATGPLGEYRAIGKAATDLRRDWEDGDPNPIYWVIDDQLNYERYIYIELEHPDTFTIPWLLDLSSLLEGHLRWGIGLTNIRDGYVLVFAQMLLVWGKTFEGCKDIASLVEAGRAAIARADNA